MTIATYLEQWINNPTGVHKSFGNLSVNANAHGGATVYYNATPVVSYEPDPDWKGEGKFYHLAILKPVGNKTSNATVRVAKIAEYLAKTKEKPFVLKERLS